MQEQSKAISPYARDVNAALGNLAPFAEDTTDLLGILRRQQAAVAGCRVEHRRGVRRAVGARASCAG